jgi:hypothetical protein
VEASHYRATPDANCQLRALSEFAHPRAQHGLRPHPRCSRVDPTSGTTRASACRQPDETEPQVIGYLKRYVAPERLCVRLAPFCDGS